MIRAITHHHRGWLVALVPALALACSSGSPQGETMPRLPGDGDADSKPAATKKAEPADPWAGRKDLLRPPQPSAPAVLELPPIERFTLKNGLRVVVARDASAPVVAMQVLVDAGTTDVADRRKAGVAELAAAMLPRGTRTRTSDQIQAAVEARGAVLATDADAESTQASCRVVAAHRDLCAELLADVLANAAFPDEQVKTVKQQLVAAVSRRAASPPQLAAVHFSNLLWGAGHARGWPLSRGTVEGLERKDLVRWHATWFKPNNAVLAIAGDVGDAAALRKQLERRFGTWRRGKVPARKRAAATTEPGEVRVRLVDVPRHGEAYIHLGHPGLPRTEEDFAAALLVSHVLGGSTSSRLMTNLPTAEGQRLPSAAILERARDGGEFVATAVLPAKGTVPVLQRMLSELQRMLEEGPSAAEIRTAAAQMSGAYAIRLQTALELARALASAELHGLPPASVGELPARLAKVTPAQAKAAADRLFKPESLVIVIAGDAATIGPQLDGAGIAFERVDFRQPVAAWERNGTDEAVAADPKAQTRGRELIAKALAAKGGRDKLEALRSLDGTTVATVTEGGKAQKLTFRRRYVRPDKLRHDITNGNVTFTITINGSTGWGRHPAQGVAALPPSNVAEAKKQLWRDHEFILLRAGEDGVSVQALPDETLDGARYHVVRLAHGGQSTRLYLDPKTFFLARMSYVEQGSPVTEVFADYKPIDGVQIAHKRTTVAGASSMEAQLREMKLGVEIPDSVFQKPAQ